MDGKVMTDNRSVDPVIKNTILSQTVSMIFGLIVVGLLSWQLLKINEASENIAVLNVKMVTMKESVEEKMFNMKEALDEKMADRFTGIQGEFLERRLNLLERLVARNGETMTTKRDH